MMPELCSQVSINNEIPHPPSPLQIMVEGCPTGRGEVNSNPQALGFIREVNPKSKIY